MLQSPARRELTGLRAMHDFCSHREYDLRVPFSHQGEEFIYNGIANTPNETLQFNNIITVMAYIAMVDKQKLPSVVSNDTSKPNKIKITFGCPIEVKFIDTLSSGSPNVRTINVDSWWPKVPVGGCNIKFILNT